MDDQPPLNSLGSKLDHAIQVTISSAGTSSESKSQKSYAADKYQDVEVDDQDRVSHPYDSDCPYCHNLKHSDMVSMRDKMRTDQSMKKEN